MRPLLPYLLAALVILGAGLAEWLQGRLLICKCGSVKLWHGTVFSAENSQHLADWYTPSHLVHGFLFFAALWLVARRVPLRWRFLIAVALEAAWEVLENSSIIIERYRAVTISLDYFGDSVLNSISDIAACCLGFYLARRLPVWTSVVIVVGLELFTGWMIRDGLALNLLMLIHPLDAVREWQGAIAR